ncbi:hypothetical protein COP1_047489 [Malus domestica]
MKIGSQYGDFGFHGVVMGIFGLGSDSGHFGGLERVKGLNQVDGSCSRRGYVWSLPGYQEYDFGYPTPDLATD